MRKKHGMTGTKEWRAWVGLRSRCLKPVCKRWLRSFKNFFSDMGLAPSPKHSIERKNNNKGYCKSNCVWATRKEQNNNRRNNRQIVHEGRSQTLQAWADEVGVDRTTLATRLNAGWPVADALTADKHTRGSRITHCPQGHEYTEANVLIEVRQGYPCRSCRQCKREWCRAWQLRTGWSKRRKRNCGTKEKTNV